MVHFRDSATDGGRRLHLDFGSDDVEAHVERAVALGASRVEDHWAASFLWFVLVGGSRGE